MTKGGRFTAEDIADAAGVTLSTYRKHRELGMVSPGDLISLSRYVMWCRMKPEKRDAQEAR